jgi:hypothetical protein
MTLQVPIELPMSDSYRVAIDAVNRWRGHCVERYARAEYEVTATLSAMAAVPNSTVSVPNTFREKLRRLRDAVEPGQTFGNRRIARALINFDGHFERRNMLVHASGKIWTDEQGGWLWQYRFQPSAKGSQMEIGTLTEKEALKIEKELAHAGHSLGGQLRTLRQKLEGRHEVNS